MSKTLTIIDDVMKNPSKNYLLPNSQYNITNFANETQQYFLHQKHITLFAVGIQISRGSASFFSNCFFFNCFSRASVRYV